MSTTNKMFCAFVFLLMINACSKDVFVTHNGNMPSNDRITMVQKGQDKARVREILGVPSSISPLDNNTWIYMQENL